MLSLSQNFIKHPKTLKAFDWSVFAGGMASLVFAVTMTLVQGNDTRNAGAVAQVETLASL